MLQMEEEKKLSSVTAQNQFRMESVVLMSDASISQLKQNASIAGQVIINLHREDSHIMNICRHLLLDLFFPRIICEGSRVQ